MTRICQTYSFDFDDELRGPEPLAWNSQVLPPDDENMFTQDDIDQIERVMDTSGDWLGLGVGLSAASTTARRDPAFWICGLVEGSFADIVRNSGKLFGPAASSQIFFRKPDHLPTLYTETRANLGKVVWRANDMSCPVFVLRSALTAMAMSFADGDTVTLLWRENGIESSRSGC